MNPLSPVEQALALAQQGAVVPACRVLERAIAAGDGLAAATLADWRLSGDLIRRDITMARDLYGRAAGLGIDDAMPVYTAMLANCAPRDWPRALSLLGERARHDGWARRQFDCLGALDLTATGEPRHVSAAASLRSTPFVGHVPGFLSPGECAYLIDLAQPRLQPSVVVDPQGRGFVRDTVRTGDAAGFPFVVEDPLLHAISRRIAAVTATCYEQGEPVQVLRYQPGEQYRLHTDALPGEANQRVITVLVALSADYTGGETHFPDLDLDWRGQVGEALIFANVDAAGQPAARARHAGRPVTDGVKHLLSKWIRRAPLDLSGPKGRPL